MTRPLNIHQSNFELHPSGALYWKEQSMLLISDVHLGKVSHFRKYGAAVPQKAIAANFRLLDSTLQDFLPGTVCFLGDLFHSHLNSEWELFREWVSRTSAEIILVAGNHDIISPLKYEALDIKVVPELLIGQFLLTHHPEEREGFFNFAGHIHPAVRICGEGRQSMRLPCFFKSPRQMILPAFGTFTGMHTLEQKNDNEVFAIAEDQVIKL
ncbi:ligase-associated DNA damage response endonuclease PdeM [Zeaxanthinibacter enoshimensis]|uniref:DNA ligase-associated metallophosphoesterase n=1 Tax=Zeaxanthinibacter enoshimensis TaxID=392009 RepID=A0A4R6TQF9_9FLAO|nr:ligase-associated DNA damage response endonuclease PdeM [Zeaxanthinibacter enoshimensis]TDQ32527.1 DNA ligase-associated metallophosphoesterase [Zeaxanthinibacter enoshimensis]